MSLAALCFILLGMMFPAGGAARQLHLAFVFDGETWDFGWTFHANLARITVMETLIDRHPDMNISHDYAFLPDNYDGNCDPQLLACWGWLRSGTDIIVSTGVQVLCFARLSQAYPNVTFLQANAPIVIPPNYANVLVRLYQPAYLAGYTAGLMTKAKKVCVSAMAPFAQALTDVLAFSLGVRNADPSVALHIFRTGQIRYPLLEVWIVNQSYALGCDVVWVPSPAIDATVRAQELGLMSVGWLTDARQTVGEGVITSAVVDLAPAYLRAVEAVLNGTFWPETQKPDWWMGWNWGVTRMADFSFQVPRPIQATVQAQVPMLDRIFCGRVCIPSRCLCNSSACCVTDQQLAGLDAYPDFAQDHGVMQLPGLACKAGQLATWHLASFAMQCTDCPAGTYAYNADQVSECRPCPAATYSASGSTTCSACPPGTYGGSFAQDEAAVRCTSCPSGLSNRDGTQCETASLVWVGTVGGGVGGGLLAVGLLLLGLARKYGKRNNRAAPKETSRAAPASGPPSPT